MALLLSRLGRFSFRRRRLVAGLWVVVLAAFGVGAATLSTSMTNTVSIPGTESQQALNQLQERFPEAGAGGATARVAIAAPEGSRLEPAVVGEVVRALNAAPKVAGAADPFRTGSVSPDGRVAMVQVKYAVPPFDITDADREALQAAADPGREQGLAVEFGGDAFGMVVETGATEVVGVLVAAVVLIVTFGSLVAAGLPLLTALVGVGVGMAGIMLSTSFLDLNANTPILALMLGLAVGIDYALFIMSRYRSELRGGTPPEEAAGRAVGTAGSAVVFAGLTVMIALAGLTVVGIPILGEMGIAASATVAIAVLVAVTLLPAVLGFAGSKVLGGRIPGLRTVGTGEGVTAGQRWATFVARHRVPVLLVSVAALLVVAIPGMSMRLGLPGDDTASPDSTQRKAYELISSGFGEGMNSPLLVVADTHGGDPRQVGGAIARQLSGLDDVAMVTPPQANAEGNTALLTVIPRSGPSSEETERLVADIRDQRGAIEERTGATLSVTGATAMNIDVSQKMSQALLPYLSLIVGLAFILLMLVFRSVVVPLKATLGFLGSVIASFGAVVAVFQWGWLADVLGVDSVGPIMSMLPILLIGILFGLAMDYQVFLVTRMREEYVHGAEPARAMVTGYKHGARVVTAAALIMTSVFAGFVFADAALIQSIGFALAFGVLVDAFVVRMTIVPAVMSLLGKHAWWLPRWLDRILPNVDIEGEKLRIGRPPEGGQGTDRTLEPV
ncbi:MMPL family transporter [Prauserella oleivorans]|uniref:MMPL family transporter n=1 Tax=Prauserella oleivorans TaxID=1478153 RepID=A0ABW5WCW3_9PSEU